MVILLAIGVNQCNWFIVSLYAIVLLVAQCIQRGSSPVGLGYFNFSLPGQTTPLPGADTSQAIVMSQILCFYLLMLSRGPRLPPY